MNHPDTATSAPLPEPHLGVAGRLARSFQSNALTPLLAIVALLLGLFAVLVTPREEEPQINVTMANVLIPFPGAAVGDVEQMVATPAEQVLSQIAGIEHVMSVSRPGLAVVTVQFKVGVPRIEALKPDILVKGGDYDSECTDPQDPRYIVGSAEVRSTGGQVATIGLVPGRSTTAIASKLKGQ